MASNKDTTTEFDRNAFAYCDGESCGACLREYGNTIGFSELALIANKSCSPRYWWAGYHAATA